VKLAQTNQEISKFENKEMLLETGKMGRFMSFVNLFNRNPVKKMTGEKITESERKLVPEISTMEKFSPTIEIEEEKIERKEEKPFFNYKKMMLHIALWKKLCHFPRLKAFYEGVYDARLCNTKQFRKRFIFLIADFKYNNLLQDYYLFFDFLRHFFITSTIGIFYSFPYFQICSICTINLLFYLIMIIGRPFKNKILMFLTFINESLINLALLSALNLAIQGKNGSTDVQKKQYYGWIIIFANLALMYILVVVTVIRIISMVPWKKIRCKKGLGKVHNESAKNGGDEEKTIADSSKNASSLISDKKKKTEISVFNFDDDKTRNFFYKN